METPGPASFSSADPSGPPLQGAEHLTRPRLTILMLAGLTAAAWTHACGDGGTEPQPPADSPRPTTVTVTPAAAELTAIGATVQLTAEVRDQNGNVMAGAAVAWSSSSASVATVDGSGLVTAVANGAATITATAGTVSGSASVTVAQEVSTVVVSPAADTLVEGDTLRLVAEARDESGHPVAGAEFSWASSDSSVAVVDASGLVTGVGAGQVTVTATSTGATGSAELTVVAPAPTTVAVIPDTVAFTAIGETAQLAAEVRDQNGNVMSGVAVTWSSSSASVATVDGAGLVKAAGNGAATITATAGTVSGSASVTVTQVVSTVAVSPAADTLVEGDTLRLVAEARDESGHPVAGAEFSWASSDSSVAVVDASGLVTAIGAGKVEIAATSAGVTGRAELEVEEPIATTVIVIPDRVTLEFLGDTASLRAEVRNQLGRPMDGPTVEWSSSDTRVATVDPSGLVTAVANGAATVTATAGSVTGSAIVSVTFINRAPEAVGSVPDQAISVGQSATIDASAYFRDPDGDALTYAASSSNTTVASASVSGSTVTVGGVGTGSATVTVTARDPDGLSAAQLIDVSVEGPSRDREALVALFRATGGDFRWDVHTNWLSDQPLGTWYGVTTNDNGRVIELSVPDNGLWGEIPREIVHLQKLKRMDLSENRMDEALPAEIGDLRDLEALNLSGNSFLGWGTSIPAELGKLSKLRWLNLNDTRFEGRIPPELGNLKSVTRLELADLWVYGSVPPEFRMLANLRHLDISDNRFLEGGLPQQLTEVPLEFFHWDGTDLCAPDDPAFQAWLLGISDHMGEDTCGPEPPVILLDDFNSPSSLANWQIQDARIQVSNGVMELANVSRDSWGIASHQLTTPVDEWEAQVGFRKKAAGTHTAVTLALADPGQHDYRMFRVEFGNFEYESEPLNWWVSAYYQPEGKELGWYYLTIFGEPFGGLSEAIKGSLLGFTELTIRQRNQSFQIWAGDERLALIGGNFLEDIEGLQLWSIDDSGSPSVFDRVRITGLERAGAANNSTSVDKDSLTNEWTDTRLLLPVRTPSRVQLSDVRPPAR